MPDREIPLAASQVIARELSIGPVEAQDLCDELGRFFCAVVSHDTMLTPSRAIDDAWHALMSDSKIHAEFCIAVCGSQVQHLPGQATTDDYRRTLAIMRELRDDRLSDYWPSEPAEELAAQCRGGNPAAPDCGAIVSVDHR
jgi:hypothetical protein